MKAKNNSKAAEKKKERLAMQKKMDSRILIVKAANAQANPLDALPSFKTFSKNGIKIDLITKKVTDMDQTEKDFVWELLRKNMQAMYENSDWGWNDKNKLDELMEDAAWYLLAKDAEGKLCGFSHFRFDMDYDDEVLYVYEIQLEEQYRRKGLGKFMMQVLELLAFKADMRKIMLTVFKHNPDGQKFFKTYMKFEIDETCPIDDVYEQFDYEILSKMNKRKLAREMSEEENKTCCGGC